VANYFTVPYTENQFAYLNTPVHITCDPDTNGIFSLENIIFGLTVSNHSVTDVSSSDIE